MTVQLVLVSNCCADALSDRVCLSLLLLLLLLRL
jgi:hypothetical protein